MPSTHTHAGWIGVKPNPPKERIWWAGYGLRIGSARLSPEQLLLFSGRLGSNLELQQALNASAKDEI
jgi:hypothetical protein